MSSFVMEDIVREILRARVYDVAVESPLVQADKLSAAAGCSVYLKREDLQPVHSFKLRGAYNKIVQLPIHARHKGIIAASAGNHAQGVALAAQKLGINALIVMPKTTPAIKVEAVMNYGATVELFGDSYSEAAEHCAQRTADTGRTFIHPFDDPLVIAGQGTIGREIVEQLPTVTHVFVSVGGGGLIAGIASYIKAIRPDVKIISVEPEDSNCLAASVKAGRRVILPHVGIFADGVAVKQVGSMTYTIAKRHVDDYITVTTDQICYAIKSIFEDTRGVVEPAGALGVAGIQQYSLPANAHAVAVCTGANVPFERLQQIAERTLLGSGKEGLFHVTLPEKPGALQHFCNTVVTNRNITEFSYRLHERSAAHVLVGISVNNTQDRVSLVKTVQEAGYPCEDLTDDDMAKEHIRHMIGGRATTSTQEAFYQVDFPERPGALGDFLSTLHDKWNISLFHYRSAASDMGNVLIGFESNHRSSLNNALAATRYDFTRCDESRTIQSFIAGGQQVG